MKTRKVPPMHSEAATFRRSDGLTFIMAASGQIYELRPVSWSLAEIRQAVAAGLLTPADPYQNLAVGGAVHDQSAAPPPRPRAPRHLELLR